VSLRVLHVHSGNLYGGVETMLLTLARHPELASGVRWQFALGATGKFSDALAALGAAPVVIGLPRFARPWTLWSARAQLALLLRRQPADVAIVHSLWTLAVWGPALRAAGVPIVLYAHSPSPGPAWLERRARRTPPALVIANSRYTADHLVPALASLPCEVIHPPLTLVGPAPEARAPVRRALGVGDAAGVLLQVARMEEGKGHRVALEALAPVRGDWVYWIVGGAQRPAEAAYARSLRALAGRLGIAGRVTFLGERTDVPALLAAADIFVQPSTEPEGFGLALVEAMAAGRAAVASDSGATPEFADERCARLVPPAEVPAWTGAFRELLGDSGLRAALGRAAEGRARQACDPAIWIPRLGELLASQPALHQPQEARPGR